MLAYFAHLHSFGLTFRCAKKKRHEDTYSSGNWLGWIRVFRIEVVIQRLLRHVELVIHVLPEF